MTYLIKIIDRNFTQNFSPGINPEFTVYIFNIDKA